MRRAVALLAVVALAGCAHDSAQAPPKTTTSSPGVVGPQGHLLPEEYRSIVREYRRLKPLQNGNAGAAELARGRRACAELRDPDTRLVRRVRADCDNALAFFAALRNLVQGGSGCQGSSQSDRIGCVRERYLRMAAAMRATREDAVAINEELRRRGIGGLCARSIGITQPQIELYRNGERAARDAADALAAGDSNGFELATREFSAALGADTGGDPLVGIERGCRTTAPKRSRPRPKAPRKPLPQVPDGQGVKA